MKHFSSDGCIDYSNDSSMFTHGYHESYVNDDHSMMYHDEDKRLNIQEKTIFLSDDEIFDSNFD